MLRSRDDLIKEQKKQIEELNQVFKEFDLNQRSLEFKISEMSNEIKEKNYIAQKESRIRLEKDKENENMEKIIIEKDKEIKKIVNDLEFLHQQKDKLYEDNSRMFNELDRLKKHIYIITDQNQQVIFYFKYFFFIFKKLKLFQLCDELDIIQDQDEKIKNHLNRKERINKIIKTNINHLDGSLKQIEDLNDVNNEITQKINNKFSPVQRSLRQRKVEGLELQIY